MTDSGSPLRVVVADDQRAVREALATVLDVVPGIVVVGEAADGEEAVARTLELCPDVVLMDLRMPNVDGVAATRRIAAERPDVKVVVLTTFADDASILGALQAGAVGYLTKDAGREQIALAVRSAAAGQSVLDPAAQNALLRAAVTAEGRRQAGGTDPARTASRRPDPAGGRRAQGHRGRADEPRDRARALHRRGDGQEPHQSPVRQDRRPQPGRGRQVLLRPGARPSLGPGKAYAALCSVTCCRGCRTPPATAAAAVPASCASLPLQRREPHCPPPRSRQAGRHCPRSRYASPSPGEKHPPRVARSTPVPVLEARHRHADVVERRVDLGRVRRRVTRQVVGGHPETMPAVPLNLRRPGRRDFLNGRVPVVKCHGL